MRSFTTLDLQYAHRFYGFKGEAQYLHGHTGILTIEVEDTIEDGVNMVFPCNEIKKIAWEVLQNFDHALVLREDDPLLPAILSVYEAQGIRNGAPTNKQKGPAFKTELATAYPECRLVVTKETMTVEGMIKIVYELLKDKLNIVKLTFTSGVNGAIEEYEPQKSVARCPLCGIALNENAFESSSGMMKQGSMYRGISAEAYSQHTSKVWREIVDFLDFKGYVWLLDGLWYNSDDDVFQDGVYSKEQLLDLLNSDFVIMEARLRLYPCSPCFETALHEIETFEQYISSECIAMIFCSDTAYFDVYLKNQGDIMALFQRLSNGQCEHIYLTTDENDGRYRFS